MNSITQLWNKNKGIFENKTLSQILAFAGDGKLQDGNVTSSEFRELLDHIPSQLLKEFSDNCLNQKFDENGFALQDIINQAGIRLGFHVDYGIYRGRRNLIGFDGIWTSDNGYSIVVEVKTTDSYRINLDTLAAYRNQLIESNRISKQSSILIVVGRNDTGDLEAQIRGSKHAWDIRLISTESLLKLLTLKETFNDTQTIKQINELLKPKEFTRLDTLIELIFLTSMDLQLDDTEGDLTSGDEIKKISEPKFIRVDFREKCVEKIQNHLKINFLKQSRIAYSNKEKTAGLICSISKIHDPGKNENYWFSLYPHQCEFLTKFHDAYISYGCGSADNVLLIPYKKFEPFIRNFLATENDERMYYHVTILYRDNRFLIQQPKVKPGITVDISKFLI
jgi:hypothetical protein